MFKHTPKPWKYDEFGGMIWSTVPTIGGAAQVPANFRIADVRGWGHLQYNADGKEVQEANGRLMTAAPVLLDELVKIRDGLHCTATSANAQNDICQVTFTCAACRQRAHLTKVIDEATVAHE